MTFLQKLDPAVMHVSCIKAGTLLARLGRPEARNCINGLEQYSYSYEEAGDQAAEMKKTYGQAQDMGPQFRHMAQFISVTTPDTTAMAVDVQDSKSRSSSSNVSVSSTCCVLLLTLSSCQLQSYMNPHSSYRS